MRKLWTFVIPIAALGLLACASQGLARADVPTDARIDALERKLQELQRLYEARIAILEREITGLKMSLVEVHTASLHSDGTEAKPRDVASNTMRMPRSAAAPEAGLTRSEAGTASSALSRRSSLAADADGISATKESGSDPGAGAAGGSRSAGVREAEIAEAEGSQATGVRTAGMAGVEGSSATGVREAATAGGDGSSPSAAAETPPATNPPPSDLEKQLEKELGAAPGTTAPQVPGQPSPQPAQPWSPAQPITIAGGGKNYLNLSFDTLVAGGSSSARDVGSIETGGHDPAQRGFTVQNVETVLEGAVDPYFRGQGNIVLQIDPEGNTSIELEEAYLTSTSLPHNLQAKAGMYFSEFGRLNAQHPHSWDFVDQPLVNGRFLGPDGLRNPGVRVSWLMPLHFYSELFLSVQDSQGGTAASFRGEPGEVFAGRTLQSRDLRTAGDLLYVPRWSGSFDLSDTQTLVVGASGALGPNGSGTDTSTRIYGLDLFWKWKPANAQAGFPFVKWQTEAMVRRYEAGAFSSDTDGDGTTDLLLPNETLRDRGAYSQIVWGFRRNWVAGLRGDYVAGDDAAFEPDPSRQTRWRVSPNLTWFPTEYSKFRVQWNHDHLEEGGKEESLWVQFEFLLGAHAAHKF